MRIEHLIWALREHISLAENSKYCAEKGDEEKSNKYDDEMQEIESYLMEKLGIELDSYGTIQTLEKEDPADRDDRLYHEGVDDEAVDRAIHNHPLGVGFAQKDKKGDK